MTQPTALDIPSEVQQLLKRYVKETTALLGSQLEGILLYGSAEGGEFLPGRSNLNLLLMQSGYEREGMKRYAKAHKRWSREQFVGPLLVTEAELTRPGTVFHLEYLEIQEQHRVLWEGGIRSSACTSTGRIWPIKSSRAFKGTWFVCGSDISKAAARKKR